MPRKKNPNNQYFNQEVEDAVCAYLNSTDDNERNKLFKIIYPALCKIAQVWYHKVKFSYSDDDMEDVMANCVAWLVEKMPMFKCGMGTKAYSYYSVTARFYYIQLANKNYRYFQKFIPLSEMTSNWDVQNEDAIKERQDENAALYYAFLEYLLLNREKIFTQKYLKFSLPFLDLLQNFEQFEVLNRRDILNELWHKISYKDKDRQAITRMMTNVCAQFTLFKRRWETGDVSMELCVKDFLTSDEQLFIKENLRSGKQKNGVRGFARKFGVDTELIRQYVQSIL